jgi:hypothetical protein
MLRICKICALKATGTGVRKLLVKAYTTDGLSEIVTEMKMGHIHGDLFQQIRHCKAFAPFGVKDLKDTMPEEKPKTVRMSKWMNKWVEGHDSLAPKKGHSLDASGNPCLAEDNGQLKEPCDPNQRCGLYCCQDVHTN